METVDALDYSELVALNQEEALRRVLASYPRIGLQATELGRARRIVQRALYHKRAGDAVFLAYTSNLISSGLRDTFACLARDRLIDGFISTAGGIEEDAIKCLGKTLVGQFSLDGRELRRCGVNRTGNLLVPNDNYCHFENFFMPVLKHLHELQRESRWETMTAPSEMIAAIGAALGCKHPETCSDSLLYWCYRNNIPVFSPALTDGSIGDMIYFYNYSKKGLVLDPIVDVVRLRELGCRNRRCDDSQGGNRSQNNNGRTTCIVLGGGLPKHHLLQNVRADTVVYVSTGLEVDASPSSCNVAEDRANGVLLDNCEVVRVHGDASFVFPLLLCKAETSADTHKDVAA
ncbi:deoxyhypusine synthase, putative [Trypanosoma cruzi]|uniref:Deoxyhypusine synthase, putative n=1 Tax=Trypanosoma cruzi (strain CL Brener) TaxID=353153 RepID=Q4DWQ6_TRYCC|nr:deoxyhypusine synthase, putative [Trypanosoma cruzi]EAN96948.1 deoxyhypusine synthase, putative [Trypanosoma cruzi]|eukprot:XP_818799.1 deoxyhypusine synthase [Trypanosoma cruzi strain CL Brener]